MCMRAPSDVGEGPLQYDPRQATPICPLLGRKYCDKRCSLSSRGIERIQGSGRNSFKGVEKGPVMDPALALRCHLQFCSTPVMTCSAQGMLSREQDGACKFEQKVTCALAIYRYLGR